MDEPVESPWAAAALAPSPVESVDGVVPVVVPPVDDVVVVLPGVVVDGFGVLELGAGGGLLGAPPDPNANPMTLPEGGA